MTIREGSSWNPLLICSVLPVAASLKPLPDPGRVKWLPRTCSTAYEELMSSAGKFCYWYLSKHYKVVRTSPLPKILFQK